MVYNPATDFLGLWRASGGSAAKSEMPGLDYMLAALARAGVIALTVSATAPVANQATTAWLKAAVPSYSAEGAFFLWDKVTTAYLPATAALFLQFLEASAGENGVSWWTCTGGAPANTVGNNGDFAIRTDEPGGIYGPKAVGAWPGSPIPGTTDIIGSTQLDNTFGTAEGQLIVRGPAVWQALGVGAANSIIVSSGALPQYETLTSLLDALFSSVQGAMLFRGPAAWQALAPAAAAGLLLAAGGPGANPSWAPRTAEFPSGTVMIFQQSAAPTGWTKQTAVNDYGLRVTSGAVGTTPGTAFSTVFAQTAVGNTTLVAGTMPSHAHSDHTAVTSPVQANPGGSHAFLDANSTTATGNTGGDGPHAHSVNLTLAYVDVIIASKN